MSTRFELTDELLNEALAVADGGASADLRASIRLAVGTTRQGMTIAGHWPIALRPIPAWSVILVVAALLLALTTVVVGSRLLELWPFDTSNLVVPPAPTSTQPAPATPTPGSGTFALWPWEDTGAPGLTFGYTLPTALQDVDIERTPSVVGFAEGSRGLTYGRRYGDGTAFFADSARGVVVADVTGVHMRGSEASAATRSAAEFFQQLRNERRSGGDEFSVGSIEDTRLAGFPALSADVTSTMLLGYPTFAPEGFDLNLNGHSKLIGADIGGRIILAQLWARHGIGNPHVVFRDSPAEDWQALAALVESIVFVASTPAPPTPAPDGTFSVWAWQMPNANELRFEYHEPENVDFDVHAGPSAVGFESLGRGVVIADITATTLFGGTGPDMPPDGRAADFVDSLLAHQFQLAEPLTATEFAGSPALAFDIVDSPPYAWIEWGDDRDDLSLAKPSRLIVADVGARVVVAQIWVDYGDTLGDEAARLAAWLPTANEFIDSMRLVDADESAPK